MPRLASEMALSSACTLSSLSLLNVNSASLVMVGESTLVTLREAERPSWLLLMVVGKA